jgi:uncharacterized repeat protein (TIGR03803 family)
LKKTKTRWREITLFEFDSSFPGASGGYFPYGVIFDSAGNLYGTTTFGGVDYLDGFGVAFELTPTSSGAWQETVLHTFLYGETGGLGTGNPLVIDSAGNLYGTTAAGGSGNYGTVFQLKRSANGAWSEVVLHSFPTGSTDGQYPNGLLVDSKGNLYGTTSGGGSAGVGTVFEIKP